MYRTGILGAALAALSVTGVLTILAAQEKPAHKHEHQHEHKHKHSPQPAADQRLPRPILNTHQLMELLNEPWYRFTREAMAQEPADAESWRTIQERGLQAAELANLVAIRDRREKWQQLSAQAQEAALRLAKAAQTRDWAATQEAHRGLINSCNTCHQTIAPDHAPQLDP